MSPIYIPPMVRPEKTRDDCDPPHHPASVQVMFDHYCPRCGRNLCLVTYQTNVLTTWDFVKPQYYASVQCISFGQMCDLSLFETDKYLENALAAVNEAMQRFGERMARHGSVRQADETTSS